MTNDNVRGVNGVRGHITLWKIDETSGSRTFVGDQPNQIQYSWGYIAARQIGYRPGPDRPNYHISAVYIEFENQSDPETAIAVSPFGRDVGISYYNGLSSSNSRDFLRIPLILEPAGSVSTGFEGNLPTEQQLNKLTFFAQTVGTVGVHGKPFSHAGEGGSSKVFSAALVAAPNFSDRTKDVIFARTVFQPANQITKEASSQIGLTWAVAFE